MVLAELGAVFDGIAAGSFKLPPQLHVDVDLALELVFDVHLKLQ
jgi:hypothetical protein